MGDTKMTKTLTTAAIAAALMLLSSIASAADCGPAPTAPKIPDGATAKGDDMETASLAIEKYSTGMSTWRECSMTAINTLGTEYGATVKEWQAQLAAYQARGAQKKSKK